MTRGCLQSLAIFGRPSHCNAEDQALEGIPRSSTAQHRPDRHISSVHMRQKIQQAAAREQRSGLRRTSSIQIAPRTLMECRGWEISSSVVDWSPRNLARTLSRLNVAAHRCLLSLEDRPGGAVSSPLPCASQNTEEARRAAGFQLVHAWQRIVPWVWLGAFSSPVRCDLSL